MEIPDRLFETILLAVRDAAEEVENGNLTVTDIPEVYENACKKLACFSELSKDNQPEQILEAREKARTGEWFRLPGNCIGRSIESNTTFLSGRFNRA